MALKRGGDGRGQRWYAVRLFPLNELQIKVVVQAGTRSSAIKRARARAQISDGITTDEAKALETCHAEVDFAGYAEPKELPWSRSGIAMSNTKLPLSKDPGYIRAHVALHRVWSRAVGTRGYRKNEWLELEQAIVALALRTSALLLAVLAGCGVAVEPYEPPTSHVAFAFAEGCEDPTDEQLAGLERARVLWAEVGVQIEPGFDAPLRATLCLWPAMPHGKYLGWEEYVSASERRVTLWQYAHLERGSLWAHELGHVLGLPHLPEGQLGVMDPWSSCYTAGDVEGGPCVWSESDYPFLATYGYTP